MDTLVVVAEEKARVVGEAYASLIVMSNNAGLPLSEIPISAE